MKETAAQFFARLSPLKENNQSNARSRKEGKSGRCHCCPYGYHIDLDFVRFCESLTQGSKNDTPVLRQMKKLKRERRRETKSMEMMLGVSGSSFDKSQLKSLSTSPWEKPEPPVPPPRKQSLRYSPLYQRQFPPPDVVINSAVYRNQSVEANAALQEAVQDFEQIFESSKELLSPKSQVNSESMSVPTLDLLSNTPTPAGENVSASSYINYFDNSSKNYFGSQTPNYLWTSADLGYGGLSSTSNNQVRSTPIGLFSPIHGMAQPLEFDTMSIVSSVSGVSTTTLQSIRDQVATGLNRLKELEDEVKMIPIFQIQVSILEEEKKILMEYIQAFQKGEDLKGVPLLPPVLNDDLHSLTKDELNKRLSSLQRKLSIGRRGRSQSPLRVNLEEFLSYRKTHGNSDQSDSEVQTFKNRPYYDMTKKMLLHSSRRDQSTSCKALTRDVGVSCPIVRTKTIGTSTDNVLFDASRRKDVKVRPCLECFRRKPREHKSTSTENETFKTYFKHFGETSAIISRLTGPLEHPPKLTFDNWTNTDAAKTRNQRTNTYLIGTDLLTRDDLREEIRHAKKGWDEMQKNKSKKQCLDAWSQTFGNQTYKRDSSSQTWDDYRKLDKKITKHTGTQTVADENDVKKHKRSMWSQTLECTIRDLDEKQRKDVGFQTILSSPVASKGCQSVLSGCEKCCVYKKSVGVGEAHLTDILCDKCLNTRKRSVAVGNFNINEEVAKKNIKSVGIGVGRITDPICEWCKESRIGTFSSSVQTDELPTCLDCKKRTLITRRNISSQTWIEKTTTATNTRSFNYGKVTVGVNTLKEDNIHNHLNIHDFGSSGVQICDKCDAAITSLAKDIVNGGTTSPISATASKIPRLVEQQGSDIIVTSKPMIFVADIKDAAAIHMSPHSSSVRPDVLASTNEFSLPENKSFVGQHTYSKFSEGLVNLGFEDRGIVKEKKDFSLSTKEENESFEQMERKLEEEDRKSRESSVTVIEVMSKLDSSTEDEDDCSLSVADSQEGLPPSFQKAAARVSPDNLPPRKKVVPNREMRAALKVLNDSIGKPVRSGQQLANAVNIVQQYWFKISSQKDVDAHAVEDYMDIFEGYSRGLLQRVVNLTDISGNTAMHYTVSHGNFDVVSLLLDSKVCTVNAQNKAGYTPIMLVSLAEFRTDAYNAVIQRLLQMGDVNIKASQHGQTALMLAVSHGRMDMVQFLIEAGADVNIQDEDGSTALMCAAEHGHLAIVQFLLAQPDCDPSLMDNDGSTALTIAVEAGHKDVGVLLYKHTNLSRGSSPHSSMRLMRSRTPTTLIPSRATATPPPRSSAPASPGRSRQSSGGSSPAAIRSRKSSASLSNLIL